jgi:hypothetical protein
MAQSKAETKRGENLRVQYVFWKLVGTGIVLFALYFY